MSNTGPHTSDRELLADLKQDESNAYQSSAPQATKEHIAGAEGKLSTAIAQSEGASNLNASAREISRDIAPSGNDVDRPAIQESLHARAQTKIEEETGGDALDLSKGSKAMNMEKGSEASRLQSAAEQYDLAREGRQEPIDGESKY